MCAVIHFLWMGLDNFGSYSHTYISNYTYDYSQMHVTSYFVLSSSVKQIRN
jgi:hypothetical protein